MIHPPSSVGIRPAVVADAPSVTALFAAHLQTLGVLPNPTLDADMSDFPARYALSGGVFLVAEAPSGGLVGIAGLLHGEIRRVHVTAPWRQQGIGERLVSELLRHHPTPADGSFRAVVARQNVASQRLFERCGFRPSLTDAAAGAAEVLLYLRPAPVEARAA